MADYAPPTGPPPPKVPEGWKAIWNDQYNEWFYVNTYTKQSQWEKPTEPIYPAAGSENPSAQGALPGYDHGTAQPVGPEKHAGGLAGSNTSQPGGIQGHSSQLTEDELLARRLQEEENSRIGGGGNPAGAASGYYSQPNQGYNPAPYQSAQLPPQVVGEKGKGKAGGLLGKILGKATGKQSQHQAYGSPQVAQGYGYPPNQGYYGQPGYQQHGYPVVGGHHPPGRRPGGGMGVGGAAALGAGGGLMGGMLLANAMDGGDDGGYGGDDGGGFGGDDGGGDFGGGDFGGGD